MLTLKSGVQLIELVPSLAIDLNLHTKDLTTLQQRTKSEGESFLTKTLPVLGKAIDRGLEIGSFFCPNEFKKTRKGGKKMALPSFLKGLLSRVFRMEDGSILADIDIGALKDLRQLCYFFNKVARPFTKAEVDRATFNYVATDQSINPLFGVREIAVFDRAKVFLAKLFKGFDPKDIYPKDGPGAVADRRTHFQRLQFNTIYGGLHEKYPYYRYYHINSRDLLDRCSAYRMARRETTGKSRICFVPKDSRGPRTIAIEPAEYQYIQQGLLKAMVPWIESHWLTKGRVNFTDQSINRDLAREHSVSRLYCTMDLKDASDLVSNDLVKKLFPQPLSDHMQACRTPEIDLQNGVVHRNNKFASMGSALCFPVESLYFYSLIRSLLDYLGCNLPLYVYGDDIIFPSAYRSTVSEFLTRISLKVNETKTFSAGFFRESCGGDYYRGLDVTPVRLRSSATDRISLPAWYALSDLLFKEGLWRTVQWIDKNVITPVSKKNNLPVASGHELKSFVGYTQCFTRSPEEVYLFTHAVSRYSKGWQRRRYCLPVIKTKKIVIEDPLIRLEDETLAALPEDTILLFRWHTSANGPEASPHAFTKRGNHNLVKKFI